MEVVNTKVSSEELQDAFRFLVPPMRAERTKPLRTALPDRPITASNDVI